MTRRAIAALIRIVARIFFRRIEIAGVEHIPDTPVIFEVNHPNGLIDPLFLLCSRRDSFVSREGAAVSHAADRFFARVRFDSGLSQAG